MKIEKVPPPKSGANITRNELPFAEMKPGDSFWFETVAYGPQTVRRAFGDFLIKGRFTIRAEGKGYRFYLLK